jgi:diacylglycerol kinase family enzyme
VSTEFDKPLLVLNPKSGNGYEESSFKKIVAAWPGAIGVWGLKEIIKNPGLLDNHDLIIACGGDGTITALANLAKESGTTILPADFGSTSCIPKSVGLEKIKGETPETYLDRLYSDLINGNLTVREYSPGVLSTDRQNDFLCFAGVGILAPNMLNLIEEARKHIKSAYLRIAIASVGLMRVFDEKHELTLTTKGQDEVCIMDAEIVNAGFNHAGGLKLPYPAKRKTDLLITMEAPPLNNKVGQLARIMIDTILISMGKPPAVEGIKIREIQTTDVLTINGPIGINEIHIDSELPRNWSGTSVTIGPKRVENGHNYRILARVEN